MAYAKIRPRRGTLYEWSTVNPVLAEGELVVEVPESGIGKGLCRFKIGDGITPYDKLAYAFDGAAASAIYGGDVYNWNNIYIRSGTTQEWMSENPVLGLGEITYDTKKKKIKIGDGSTPWDKLPYIGGGGSSMLEDDYDFGDEDEEDVDPEAEDYNFGDEDDPDDEWL